MIREHTALVPVDGSEDVNGWLVLLIILAWELHRVRSFVLSLLAHARLEGTASVELEFVATRQILDLIVLLLL